MKAQKSYPSICQPSQKNALSYVCIVNPVSFMIRNYRYTMYNVSGQCGSTPLLAYLYLYPEGGAANKCYINRTETGLVEIWPVKTFLTSS